MLFVCEIATQKTEIKYCLLFIDDERTDYQRMVAHLLVFLDSPVLQFFNK